ncbi:hypothetical protein TeGR_g10418, partial [Tetraparma gracilis]
MFTGTAPNHSFSQPPPFAPPYPPPAFAPPAQPLQPPQPHHQPVPQQPAKQPIPPAFAFPQQPAAAAPPLFAPPAFPQQQVQQQQPPQQQPPPFAQPGMAQPAKAPPPFKPQHVPKYHPINTAYPGCSLITAPSSPPIFFVPNFLTSSECSSLVSAGLGHFAPSPVVGSDEPPVIAAGTAKAAISQARTSTTIYLHRDDLPTIMRK